MHKPLAPGVRAERREILRALGFRVDHLTERQLIPTKTVLATLMVLEGCGFSPAQIRVMARRSHKVLHNGPRTFNQGFLRLLAIGFTHAETLEIAYDQPNLMSDGGETVWDDFIMLVDWGFNWHDALRVCTATGGRALVWSQNRNRVVLDTWLSQGFSRKEVVLMLTAAPELLSDSAETIRKNFEALRQCGVAWETLKRMFLARPELARKNLPALRQGLDVLAYVGADFVKRAPALGFSMRLLRGRIAYLESLGQTKWPGSLFESNPTFQKRYGIGRERLVALDPGPEAFRERLTAKTAT